MSAERMITGFSELMAASLIQGTAVVLVTAAVAVVLRRARPALLAALWSVALFKFAVPIAPELPIAFGNLLGGAADVSLATSGEVTASGPALAMASPVSGPSFPWLLAVLVGLWLCGFVYVAGRQLRTHRRLALRIEGLPGAGEELHRVASSAAGAIGLARTPDVRVDAAASGAFLFGWLRPVLIMPSWPDGEQQRAMLLHELAHVRRRDPLWRLFEVAITTVFYFWPPVAWVCRQIDLNREQACDRWAVTAGGVRPGAFARLLVDVAARSRGLPQPALAMAPRPGHLERRVIHLMTRRQRPALGGVAALVVVSWSAVALAGAERDPSKVLGETLCATDPRIGEQIMASHPDADIDGDGSLSKDEVCAHQLRMQRKLVDEVVGTLPAEQLMRADIDGDGALSEDELAGLKDRLVVTVRTGLEPQLLLQMQSPLPTELASREEFATVEASRFDLATAEVSGSVCEPGVGRCVEVDARSDEGFLLIDVAVKGDD